GSLSAYHARNGRRRSRGRYRSHRGSHADTRRTRTGIAGVGALARPPITMDSPIPPASAPHLGLASVVERAFIQGLVRVFVPPAKPCSAIVDHGFLGSAPLMRASSKLVSLRSL